MMRWLNKLLHRSPVDQLIRATGGDKYVVLWNGMNYYGEFMFKNGKGEFDTPENLPYLKIGIGRYVSGSGDWGGGFDRCYSSIVQIYIDKDRIIRQIDRETPFHGGYTCGNASERKINRLHKRLVFGTKLTIKNPIIDDLITKFFAAPVETRYAHHWRADMEYYLNYNEEQRNVWLANNSLV